MSGITWRAVTAKAVSENLLMIEISKAGKNGLLLEESRPWDATCKLWRCPRPSRIPKYLWALLEQKLRQIEPMAVAPSGVQQRKVPAEKASPGQGLRRSFPGASEAIGNGRMGFPAFLAMELIEAHHLELYRRKIGFRA